MGVRLADWLDGLGLTEQLVEAGLPTFTRSADGTVRWTDSATGVGLTDDQLAALDTMLHSEGSDPEYAVPVDLLLLARQARLRAELLAGPTHTYESLAEIRGTTVDAARFAVHKAASTHRLLVVPLSDGCGARSIVPAFQLGPDGELRPELAPVLEPLLSAGMDPWRAWIWLTQPAALTLGEAPERAVRDDPDLVRHAALRLASRTEG